VSLHRPYPPDSYLGDEGEVSAWLRRSDEPADITHDTGGTCEYLATGDRTEGRFGLYRWTFGEAESGPGPHFHRSISEQFYVLSGVFAPGGPREDYFETLARGEPMTEEQRAEFMLRHDTYWV
jgi:hypothetical protein